MDFFSYQNNHLYAEELPVDTIARQYGTPCYIYSRRTLERHWHAFNDAFGDYPHLVCYAVKANSNLAVLNVLARLGSGFDIVSRGELERVLAAGGKPDEIVFSGVGKTADEIRRALEVGVGCFNIESIEESHRIADIAKQMGCVAPVSLRVNPDVDAHTHPYISTGLKENKFGVPYEEAFGLLTQMHQSNTLNVVGVDCHIGSQLLTMAPFLDALDRMLALVTKLQDAGIQLSHLDMGGGLGVTYLDEKAPSPAEYASAMVKRLSQKLSQPIKVLIEPGRAIAANAGLLVTEVQYLKSNQDKHFAIVDAGMNDLLRPALYSAEQAVVPVIKPAESQTASRYDVVGPVCETADFLAKGCQLSLKGGELLAIRSAGAYGFVMSSNYNSRPRVPEIMVDGSKAYLVRARETYQDLYNSEAMLPL